MCLQQCLDMQIIKWCHRLKISETGGDRRGQEGTEEDKRELRERPLKRSHSEVIAMYQSEPSSGEWGSIKTNKDGLSSLEIVERLRQTSAKNL